MNKKTALILAVVLAGVFLLGLWLSFRKKPTTTQLTPSVIPLVSEKDWSVIYKDSRYQIIFVQKLGAHRIVFPTAPTTILQSEAETKLLEVLKLNRSSACQLKVFFSLYVADLPGFVKDLGQLSFCAYPSPQTTLSSPSVLNPALKQLGIKSISPQSGTMPAGGTNNAVIIVFDQQIDPTTVYVSVSPEISFSPIVRKDDLNRLILMPTTNWETGLTYNLKISAGLLSLDKQFQTKEDIFFSYVVTDPSPPVLNEGAGETN